MHRHRCSLSRTLVFSATQFQEVGESHPEPKGTRRQSWNQRRSSKCSLERANPKVAESDWQRRDSVRFGDMGVLGLWSCGWQQPLRRLLRHQRRRLRRRWWQRRDATWQRRRRSRWEECALGAEETRRGSGRTPFSSASLFLF